MSDEQAGIVARVEAAEAQHNAAGLYRAMPKDVLLAVAASALDVPLAVVTDTTLVALVTEWHILHTAGLVDRPVPLRFRHLVRAGAVGQSALDASATQPAGHLYTTREAGDMLGIVPRTVRKLARLHGLGSTVGARSKVFTAADINRLRHLAQPGRPEARSETTWR
jgi:hypothetical protein